MRYQSASDMRSEALDRAENGQSFRNYQAILEGFGAMGIAESDIKPRENVFTFHAWRAKGRTVKRGEHGVKIVTYVDMTKRAGGEALDDMPPETFRRPRFVTVFHISQTIAWTVDGNRE